MSVYNLQVLEVKNLSTNLQEFLQIIVDSTINNGSNLRSTFNCPSPLNTDTEVKETEAAKKKEKEEGRKERNRKEMGGLVNWRMLLTNWQVGRRTEIRKIGRGVER